MIWRNDFPVYSACSLKGATTAFCLIVIHTASNTTGKLMKMLGVQGFILLLRILSGYNIMLCLILLVSHFFNSDFYFQPSDPFRALTP